MPLTRSLDARLVFLAAIGSALLLGQARAQDANPNAVRSGDRTALHLAVEGGHVERRLP